MTPISRPVGQSVFSPQTDRMFIPKNGLSGLLFWDYSLNRLSTVCVYSEDKVIEHYKKLKGLSRGEAIVQ